MGYEQLIREKQKIKILIEQFKQLNWPNPTLTMEILSVLGIHENVDLGICLNSKFPRERLAAMAKLEQNLDALTSGDPKRWADARDTLMQLFYKIDGTDEEAIL